MVNHMAAELTKTFLLLRQLVTANDNSNGLQGVDIHLKHLRRLATNLVEGLRQKKVKTITHEISIQFFRIVKRCWYQLSCLPDDSPYGLPPVYATPELDNIIESFSSDLLATELGIRQPCRNPIYCGCKGVGKSTILYAIGMICSALLSKAIPLYWSFDLIFVHDIVVVPSISDLNNARLLIHSNPATSFVDCLQGIVNMTMGPLDDDGLSPIPLLDEFTALYSDKIYHNEGRSIIAHIRDCGKNEMNMPIYLAASTTCIEKYAFPSQRGDYNSYPDLNSSVFLRIPIYPIRCPKTLKSNAEVRFPDITLTGEELLDKSGGVGRYIASINSHETTDCQSDFAGHVNGDNGLFLLVCALLARKPLTIQITDQTWPIWNIGYLTALEILKKAGKSDKEAVNCIDLWCDDMLFHKEADNSIGFLIPATARRLDELVRNDTELTLAFVLSITLHGFEGGTAGHSNEKLICKYIHKAVNVGRSSDNLLVFKSSKAMLNDNECSDITELTDVLYKWQGELGHEKGIDRLWLVDKGDRIMVYGLQLKTGTPKLKMTCGKIVTQRSKTKCSDVDDTTIAGVLVKAERGFVDILLGLRAAFPGKVFELEAFYIFTTKDAADGIEKFRISYPDYEENFTLAPDLSQRLNEEAKSVAAATNYSFQWTLHYGVAWLSEVLPARVHNLMNLTY